MSAKGRKKHKGKNCKRPGLKQPGLETPNLPSLFGFRVLLLFKACFERKQKGPGLISKPKGPGEQGAAGYCPKLLLLKRTKMVLCHREICTRNRPVSETKFLHDF